eukprot:Gregarina_sp_Pseudo_9__5650@NODE_792_length_2209_cov_49_531336_g746_i0_p2_GENE_NODE_792_length_2209_cov_49_531336_g746_i0NODE_792_length_2209_cov_49_531336_g746_i0_p2_ORF_typecomplete_len121_score15_85Gpr1_Fun34_YaaH/PF01184_19/1_1e15Oxidored_q2/PF00420_24/41Oxidored_q2/PF00420_24/0_002_NODE_792_length_2209_cov_49_531336_g746_i016301992
MATSYAGDGDGAARQGGVYFIGWAFFAFVYLVANLRTNAAVVCMSTLVLGNFIFLGVFSFTGNTAIEKTAAYCMMLTSVNAFYLGTAALWNGTAPVELPLFPFKRQEKQDQDEDTASRQV